MSAGNQFVDMVQVKSNFCGSTSSGIAMVGRLVRPPWAAESKGQKKGWGPKNKYFKQKRRFNFCAKKIKLSRRIKVKPINDCDLIECVILFRAATVISCVEYQKTQLHH
jgi:hypothetical protein